MGQFNQSIQDALLSESKALPAAGASNQTTGFNLGHTAPGTRPADGTEILVSVPAIAAHTDTTKNVRLKLQDSADGSSWADVDPETEVVIAGVASTGSAAKDVRMALPSTIRKYVRFNQAVDSAAGTLTGSSITYTVISKV